MSSRLKMAATSVRQKEVSEERSELRKVDKHWSGRTITRAPTSLEMP